MNTKLKFTTRAAAIAALYVLLTYVAHMLGLASGEIQLRLSEALCVLPCFTTAAIPGLAVGCLIANILTGSALWDVVFGSFATLLGAIGTYLLRKKSKWISLLPPVISNVAIVPLIIMTVYGSSQSWGFLVLTVGAGEIISCYVLGVVLYGVFEKRKKQLFD